MSSFVCVFCSRCGPNSVNTFPIVITDWMQPHCIRCLLHDLRDGRTVPSSWLPPLRRAMVENSPGRVSSSKWPCVPHVFTRLALSKPKYTFSKIHTFSRPNNSNARTCSCGCGWHSNKDPSLSKKTKPPLTALRWPGPFPREQAPWLGYVLQALQTHACWEPISCSQAVSPTENLIYLHLFKENPNARYL